MVCLLDRYFSDNLVLDSQAHQHVVTFKINNRVEVRVYTDPPMHLSLFYVDGIPVLKEIIIEGLLKKYIEDTQNQKHLPDFILDYSHPLL